MRRIISVFLAAVFVLCLSPPVYASAQNNVGTDLSFTYTAARPSYTVTVSGLDANGSWKKGTQAGLTITSDADFAKFTGVEVDGALIGADKYDARSGSTIVTLYPAYLETLAVGKHTVTIIFTDGSVETEFTILAADGNIGGNGNNGGNGGNNGGNDNGNTGDSGGDSGNVTSQQPGTPGGDTGNAPGSDNPGNNTPDGTTAIEPGDTPLGNLPEGLPQPADESHKIISDTDRPNVFIELDDGDVPLGEWRMDEESGLWIFDEYPVPTGSLPQTGISGLPLLWLLIAMGVSLAGIGICIRKLPKKDK